MKISLLSFFSFATMAAAQGTLRQLNMSSVPSFSGPPRHTPSAARMGGGGGGGGWNGGWISAVKPVIVTTVVDVFVSVFPHPTTVTINSQCYTATSSSQPVTISDCPCTVAHSPIFRAPAGITPTLVTGRLVTPSGSATLVPPPPSQQTGAVAAQKEGQSAAFSSVATLQSPSSASITTITNKASATLGVVPGQPASPYIQAGGSINIPHVIAVLLAAVPLAVGMAL